MLERHLPRIEIEICHVLLINAIVQAYVRAFLFEGPQLVEPEFAGCEVYHVIPC